MDVDKSRCIHCKKNKAQAKYRMLCGGCYNDKEIRPKYARRRGEWSEDKTTEEELDKMIEEQRANLPDWWPQTDAEWEWERLHGDEDKEE